MELLLSIVGLLVGILSAFITWFYATRNRRLSRKAEEHRKQIDKIKKYTKATGYKNILHDGFYVLFYAGAISLFALSIQTIIPYLIPPGSFSDFVNKFAAGVYGGAGGVLWVQFLILKKSYKPEKVVPQLEDKISEIENEISN